MVAFWFAGTREFETGGCVVRIEVVGEHVEGGLGRSLEFLNGDLVGLRDRWQVRGVGIGGDSEECARRVQTVGDPVVLDEHDAVGRYVDLDPSPSVGVLLIEQTHGVGILR